MNVRLEPSKLQGTLDAIPSKSHAHRILIAQKLAQLQGQQKLGSLAIPAFSEDIEATKNCLVQMDKNMPYLDCKESGSTLRFMLPVAMALKDEAVFIGSGKLPHRPISPLKEEMETHGCRFYMGGKKQSPGDKYREICNIRGRLQPGEYSLPGNISSQFITGLLFALPILDGDSVLTLTTELESAGYVDLTLDVLQTFGIEIKSKASPEGLLIYEIAGNQRYLEPDGLTVEGDWSNAAFWLAGGALGGNVTVRGLNLHSSQRDKEILDVLRDMGANISITELPEPSYAKISCAGEGGLAEKASAERTSIEDTPMGTLMEGKDRSINPTGDSADAPSAYKQARQANSATDSVNLIKNATKPALPACEEMHDASAAYEPAKPNPPACKTTNCMITVYCKNALKGTEVSVAQTPDMVPILASVMALANGASMITNAERLKIKESDRLRTVYDFLFKLGADITDGGSGLSLTGKPRLNGGEVESHNDHRIAMAAAIASCGCKNPVLIRGAEAVKKSYPAFFEDFAALGGSIKKL